MVAYDKRHEDENSIYNLSINQKLPVELLFTSAWISSE